MALRVGHVGPGNECEFKLRASLGTLSVLLASITGVVSASACAAANNQLRTGTDMGNLTV